MTFNKYLREVQNDDSAIGDFARDWIADKSENKPRSSTTFAPIERHLQRHHACAAAIKAGQAAWKQWQRQVDNSTFDKETAK